MVRKKIYDEKRLSGRYASDTKNRGGKRLKKQKNTPPNTASETVLYIDYENIYNLPLFKKQAVETKSLRRLRELFSLTFATLVTVSAVV